MKPLITLEEAMDEISIPRCLEAERVILSNLLCDKHGDAFDACSKLRPFHFFNRSHSILFDAMIRLRSDSKTTDLITVSEELSRTGKLHEIGGEDELNKLFSSYLTTAHTQDHVQLLIEKQKLRKIIEICEGVKRKAQSGDDSKLCMSDIEHLIFDIQENDDSTENQRDIACEEVKEMIEVRRNGGEVNGLITGVKPFDGVFFGVQPSQYYIIGALPSYGKTAMIDQMCGNLLMRDIPVLYISLESDRRRVLSKISCKLVDVCYRNFVTGKCSLEELNKIDKMVDVLNRKEIILMRPFDVTPMELRPMIRKWKRKSGIQIVFLDYIQKVLIPSGWDERRTVSRSSVELQRAAVETGVPVIALAQLNREAGEGSRPSMRNLKESSQIEQDADNVALIWSDQSKVDYQNESVFPCILSIDKNKDGASGIDIPMNFNKPIMKFSRKENI